MLGHNIGGGYKGVTLDSLPPPESKELGNPGAIIFLDFVWSKLVCPPPKSVKNTLG